METEHDNLQAVAAVRAFEETWLQQVRGHRRGQVDPPVGQAVTVKTKQIKLKAFHLILCTGLGSRANTDVKSKHHMRRSLIFAF